MKRSKRNVSDAQFKNQVIFTIKGMKKNLENIGEMFVGFDILILLATIPLDNIIKLIKTFQGTIRRPK